MAAWPESWLWLAQPVMANESGYYSVIVSENK